jgi:hypothetical protein
MQSNYGCERAIQSATVGNGADPGRPVEEQNRCFGGSRRQRLERNDCESSPPEATRARFDGSPGLADKWNSTIETLRIESANRGRLQCEH